MFCYTLQGINWSYTTLCCRVNFFCPFSCIPRCSLLALCCRQTIFVPLREYFQFLSSLCVFKVVKKECAERPEGVSCGTSLPIFNASCFRFIWKTCEPSVHFPICWRFLPVWLFAAAIVVIVVVVAAAAAAKCVF